MKPPRLPAVCSSFAFRPLISHSPALRRTAAIVRNGRHILDLIDIESRCLEGSEDRFSSCSRSANKDLDRADSVIDSFLGGIIRRLLGGKRSSFARSLKTH